MFDMTMMSRFANYAYNAATQATTYARELGSSTVAQISSIASKISTVQSLWNDPTQTVQNVGLKALKGSSLTGAYRYCFNGDSGAKFTKKMEKRQNSFITKFIVRKGIGFIKRQACSGDPACTPRFIEKLREHGDVLLTSANIKNFTSSALKNGSSVLEALNAIRDPENAAPELQRALLFKNFQVPFQDGVSEEMFVEEKARAKQNISDRAADLLGLERSKTDFFSIKYFQLLIAYICVKVFGIDIAESVYEIGYEKFKDYLDVLNVDPSHIEFIVLKSLEQMANDFSNPLYTTTDEQIDQDWSRFWQAAKPLTAERIEARIAERNLGVRLLARAGQQWLGSPTDHVDLIGQAKLSAILPEAMGEFRAFVYR